jgi:hypothetical protein
MIAQESAYATGFMVVVDAQRALRFFAYRADAILLREESIVILNG